MGALGMSAMSASGCSEVSCSTLATYDASGKAQPPSQSDDPGIGGAVTKWVVFWLLGALQLGTYTVYSRLKSRFPLLQQLTTPYRSGMRVRQSLAPANSRSSSSGGVGAELRHGLAPAAVVLASEPNFRALSRSHAAHVAPRHGLLAAAATRLLDRALRFDLGADRDRLHQHAAAILDGRRLAL